MLDGKLIYSAWSIPFLFTEISFALMSLFLKHKRQLERNERQSTHDFMSNRLKRRKVRRWGRELCADVLHHLTVKIFYFLWFSHDVMQKKKDLMSRKKKWGIHPKASVELTLILCRLCVPVLDDYKFIIKIVLNFDKVQMSDNWSTNY